MEGTNKKNNNFLIAFLIIVILLLCGVVCYFAFNLGKSTADLTNDDKDKTEEKVEDNTDDKIEQNINYTDYISAGSTLDKVDEKTISLNGKTHNIAIIYSYNETQDTRFDEPITEYNYYVTVMYDGKLTNVSNRNFGTYSVKISDYNEYVQLSTLKDTLNNQEYMTLYVRDNRGNGSAINYVVILDENINIKYEIENRNCFVVMDSNNQELPYMVLNSNDVLVLYATWNDKDDEFAYHHKITIENGQYKIETIDLENFSLAGGC